MRRYLSKRGIALGIAVVALVALLVWQYRRERLIADCLQLGGRWDGPNSTCVLSDGRILIRPGLRRT